MSKPAAAEAAEAAAAEAATPAAAAAATQRAILVAVILQHETCTIAFCASMLKLQVQLARLRDIAVAIDFLESEDAAWDAFTHGTFDTLVLVDSHFGVSPEFVLEEPRDDCVVSPYPLPRLDWERAAQTLADAAEAAEPPESVALAYNVDIDSVETPRIPMSCVKEMRVAKFRKGCPRAPAAVTVDLEHPSQSHGKVAYTGCVGHRRILR